MEGVGSANPPVSHPGLTMGLPLPQLTTTHVHDTLDNTNLGHLYWQRLSRHEIVGVCPYRLQIYADDLLLTEVTQEELDFTRRLLAALDPRTSIEMSPHAVDDLDPATQPGR